MAASSFSTRPAARRPMQSASAEVTASVNEFGQLALWMAARLAGMVTAALEGRRPFFDKVLARLRRQARRSGSYKLHLRPSPEQALPLLTDAMVGSSKHTVVSVIGPPRSALIEGVHITEGGEGFWYADTWFYPLPRHGALAMAIRFNDGFANNVEYFHAPRVDALAA